MSFGEKAAVTRKAINLYFCDPYINIETFGFIFGQLNGDNYVNLVQAN